MKRQRAMIMLEGFLWLSSAAFQTLHRRVVFFDGVQRMHVRWKLKSCLSNSKLFLLSQTDPRVFCVIVLQVSETIYFNSVAAGSWFLPD